MPLVPCHNDLLNANFLLDGDHVWIVDYEYAGMGDAFFDLGNLSVNNGLTPEAQEILLRLYFGRVRDVHRARLALMQLMSDFREAMWGVVQQGISTLDVDYVAYADTSLRAVADQRERRRFADWLAAALRAGSLAPSLRCTGGISCIRGGRGRGYHAQDRRDGRRSSSSH